MTTHFRLFFLITLFMQSISALASPDIIAVKGNVNKPGNIIITGSNFSSPKMPVTLLWDTVDNQPYTKSESLFAVPITEGYPWQGNCDAKSCVPTNVKTNDNSIYFAAGKRSFLGNPRIASENLSANRLYVSWMYKPGVAPGDQGGSNKFIRIWDDKNGLATRISWTQRQLYCADGTPGREQYVPHKWVEWNGNVGEWNRHEIYVDLSTGELSAWINNLPFNYVSECRKGGTEDPLYVGLIGFDSNTTTYLNMTTELDDIYISRTLARVEVSDNKIFSKSTIRQIQVIEQWDDKEITFDFYQGQLNIDQPLYIHVFDTDGNTNEEGHKFNLKSPNPVLIIN